MKAPAFWWQDRPSVLARLMQPIGAVYGGRTAARMGQAPSARAQVPVICVGNFVAGGAGKTPVVAMLADWLAASGHRPFVLSRGYGGTERGPVRVDPRRHGAGEVGDEPLMLARRHPVVVARDRPAGAALAVRDGASVIVMDDGLQNPSLHKDVALAVVDGEAGIGNGLCLPAGPLRAPVEAQIARIDAVILIGRGEKGMAVAETAGTAGKWVIPARLEPSPKMATALTGRRVLAFAGIGRPDKFFATLRDIGAEVVTDRPFADHHPYTAGELQGLMTEAAAGDLVLVTTAKDAARIPPDLMAGMKERLAVLNVSLAVDDMRTLMRLFVEKGIFAEG